MAEGVRGVMKRFWIQNRAAAEGQCCVHSWEACWRRRGREAGGGEGRDQLPGRVPTGVQLEEVQGLHATGDLDEDLSSIPSNQVSGANYR